MSHSSNGGSRQAVIRLFDKMQRLIELDRHNVDAHDMKDTVLDMANYCIMLIIEFDSPEKLEFTNEENATVYTIPTTPAFGGEE